MKYGKAGWSSVHDEQAIVKTKNGRIRGFVRNANAVFLGVPYGDRCDGDGRFLAPKPAPAWSGIRDCTQFGPVAMQEQTKPSELLPPMKAVLEEYSNVFTGGIPFDKDQETTSENCLVLNVVTPGIDERRRPVLVYIHGGGYMSGSGNVTAAICDRLVDEEDLVVVTVNHRLNVFGALYLGELDEAYSESGIVTQLDLILALRWIQANIAAFGGDPEAVTLIGESGGGMKIHHLLAMPESQNLLARAIIISGSIPAAVKRPADGTAETLEVLNNLGIARENWRQILTLPATKLLAGTHGMDLIQADRTPFMPTADGVRMPLNLSGSYQVCPATADIPLIIGSSEEELAPNLLHPELTWDSLRYALINKDQPLLAKIVDITEETADALIATFRKHCDDRKAPWQIFAQIVSTAHFLGGGSYLAARARAYAGAPIWHYTTTYDTPIPGAGDLACAWHTADLPLAFRAVYHPEAEKLSRQIAHSFAAFARTGTPESAGLQWPAFSATNQETMLFDATSGWVKNPYREIHAAIKKVRK